MIHGLVKKFDLIERDVNLLTKALTGLLLLISFRASFLLYVRNFESIWTLLGPFTSVAAALLVSRIASRLIVHGQVLRENDRRMEIVRVTHQLLAVTKDLKARVGYFLKLMGDGDKPIAVMVTVARSIEKRYETLYEKDAYEFLPGKCVDLINSLSGHICGMLAAAEILASAGKEHSFRSIKDITRKSSDDFKDRNEKILDELQTLIDQIYELRTSLDDSVSGKP